MVENHIMGVHDVMIGGMLDIKFLGSLHGVAIGITDNKSIKNFGLGSQTRVATPYYG